MKRIIKIPKVVLSISLAAMSSACVSMEFGNPLVIGGLDSLQIGRSTQSDVLLALGQPRGNGRVQVQQVSEPRDILFYEFLKTDGKNADFEMLIVFMLDQRYDGYLWFAGSERLEIDQSISGELQSAVQGYFPDIDALESKFSRGQTSNEEIIASLGSPTGIGAAIIPPEHRVQDVYYYEDIELEDMQSAGQTFVLEMRQRILLVMLTDDVYDGFMWFSNSLRGEGRRQ